MKKEKTAAIITIRDPSKMSKKGRKAIYQWLVKQAGFFRDHADELAPGFRVRYIYT